MENFGGISIIAIILLVEGLFNALGFRLIYSTTMQKYTEESVDKWIRPTGIATIIMGIGVLLFDYGLGHDAEFAIVVTGFAIGVIGIIMGLVFNKKFLVKK